MGGMLGVGQNMQANALSGMKRLSDLETSRELTKESLDRKDEQDRKSNQMGMAGLGFAAGSAMLGSSLGMVAGPIGAIGGYLLGSLF